MNKFKPLIITLLVEVPILYIIGISALYYGNPFESISEEYGGTILFLLLIVFLFGFWISLIISFYRFFSSKGFSRVKASIFSFIISTFGASLPLIAIVIMIISGWLGGYS